MAGFKQLLQDMQPATLISFDGEVWNTGTRFIDSGIIIDEMRNQDGIITQESNELVYAGYRAGGRSLIELDQFDQYSLRFCPTGANKPAERAGFSRFPKAMVSIPNNLAYNFGGKEFTYSMLVNRGEAEWGNAADTDGKWRRGAYTDILFSHGGIITLAQHYYWSTPSRWEIKLHPLAQPVLSVEGEIIPARLAGRATWLVIRFKDYTLEVFIDGNLIASKDISSLVDVNHFTIDAGSKEFTLGGQALPYDATKLYSDRLTRTYDFDAVAIFTRAITDLEIVKLFRRIWNYDEMLRVDNPSNYCRFDDDALSKGYIEMTVSTLYNARLNIIGNYRNAEPRQIGKITGTRGIRFTNGTHIKAQAQDYTKLVDLNRDYIIEFFFRTSDANRGVLFQQAHTQFPYEQLTIWFNSRRGQQVGGVMEMDLASTDIQIQIADNITFNEWHHLVIRKQGDKYCVWIDGNMVLEDYNHRADPQSGTTGVHFLSSPFHHHYLSADLSTLTTYPRALSNEKIQAHCNYDTVYRIRGTVTLMGNPTDATIRIYSHDSGKLLGEVTSHPVTGVYIFDLLSNERVDVFAFHKHDSTVKFRAYGFIVPYEQLDIQP